MTKIQIELPEATAKAAREAGLLTPQVLDRLLTDAIRRQQAGDRLLSIADRVAEAGIEPMSVEEIADQQPGVARRTRRSDPPPEVPSDPGPLPDRPGADAERVAAIGRDRRSAAASRSGQPRSRR